MIKSGQKGFSLVEIIVASAITVISLGIFLSLYSMGQRLLKAGMNQLDVERDARHSLEMISRHIREGEVIRIYDNYSTLNPGTQGNYIEVVIPAANDLGYYLNNQGEIRYIDDLDSDNPASQNDDAKIADEVVGTNVFDSSGIAIEINFSVRDNYAKDGYQGIDLQSRVEPRNN